MALSRELVEKYPSLQKLNDLGDDYEEWKDGREHELLAYIKRHPDFSQIQNNPLKVLEVMDTFSKDRDFLISVGSDKAKIIGDLLVEEHPSVIVELGGYLGYSAILFGQYLREHNTASADAHVWSLEFEPEFATIMGEIISIAGLSDMITIMIGTACESLKKLKATKEISKIDLLFLDHVEDLYLQDFTTCRDSGLLKSGSCIVADNVLRPGAPAYRKFVRDQPQLSSRVIKCLIMPGEFEDEMEVTKVF